MRLGNSYKLNWLIWLKSGAWFMGLEEMINFSEKKYQAQE